MPIRHIRIIRVPPSGNYKNGIVDVPSDFQENEPIPDPKHMSRYNFIPYSDYREYPVEKMVERSARFHAEMKRRRSVRAFSERSVPEEVIRNCIRAAGTAPSGANMQPWHFAVVRDPAVKKRIREAAEKEEREFYEHRATEEWLDVLEPLGTDRHKPFLESAPFLIVVFEQRYGVDDKGEKRRHYYTKESVGIATGMLITALHHAGLASLTHTPSPMGFLNGILDRPDRERPFLILVTGYPSDDAEIPDLPKKAIDEIASFI